MTEIIVGQHSQTSMFGPEGPMLNYWNASLWGGEALRGSRELSSVTLHSQLWLSAFTLQPQLWLWTPTLNLLFHLDKTKLLIPFWRTFPPLWQIGSIWLWQKFASDGAPKLQCLDLEALCYDMYILRVLLEAAYAAWILTCDSQLSFPTLMRQGLKLRS